MTALRQIELATGAQKILRPPGGSFAGTLSAAIGGAVLFSGPAGLTAYSGMDGAAALAPRRRGAAGGRRRSGRRST